MRFVVGDINQSIYGFRHADQNVFRTYREGIERRGGEVIRLTENFRSRPEILAMVRALLPGGRDSGVERPQPAGGVPLLPQGSAQLRGADCLGGR